MVKFTPQETILFIDRLIAADKEVEGTNEYMKYLMMFETKENGHWKFLTWSIPTSHLPIQVKTFRKKVYIYQGDVRYAVTEPVLQLLKEVRSK